MARVMMMASIALMLGVILGAFGAHTIRDRVTPEMLEIYKTGVLYHFVHGLGALLAGIASERATKPDRALLSAKMMLCGIAIFSGSLYAYASGGPRWLGMITPIGGVVWILAWGILASAFVSSKKATV